MPRATTSPWASIRLSPIHGRGMYATRAIPGGTRIIDYRGELITKAESLRREDRRMAALKRGKPGCVYIFELNQRHDIDGSASWNTARLINHSCKPNCESQIIRGRIWIIALRDIKEGEEITFDYGYPVHEWRNHPCLCGSPGCLGYIVAKADRWRLKRYLRAERVRAKAGPAAKKRKSSRSVKKT